MVMVHHAAWRGRIAASRVIDEVEFKLTTCTVRSWEWRDRDAIVRHANNRNVWINLRDRFPHPYTLADARNWLDMVVGIKPETNFAIAVDDEAVGGVGFTVQHDVASSFGGDRLLARRRILGPRHCDGSVDCRDRICVFELRSVPVVRARL